MLGANLLLFSLPRRGKVSLEQIKIHIEQAAPPTTYVDTPVLTLCWDSIANKNQARR